MGFTYIALTFNNKNESNVGRKHERKHVINHIHLSYRYCFNVCNCIYRYADERVNYVSQNRYRANELHLDVKMKNMDESFQ